MKIYRHLADGGKELIYEGDTGIELALAPGDYTFETTAEILDTLIYECSGCGWRGRYAEMELLPDQSRRCAHCTKH